MFFRLRHAFAALPVIALLLVAQVPAPEQSALSNHIVIISLDGFTARALNDPALPLPTLRKLARDGAMAKTMRFEQVTIQTVPQPAHETNETRVSLV